MQDIISINDIISELKISKATLNNWVRESILIKHKNGITLKSYNSFKRSHLGKTKLNKRANKLHKHEINNEITFNYVLKYSKKNKIDISKCYEKLLSESHKNKEGIYYTSTNVIDNIFSSILKYLPDIKNKTFLDPSCGSGNYIIKAIECGIKVENIYAYDTDPIAVKIAKYRVYQKTGIKALNIKCRNFLDASEKDTIKFDIIATNPPWGKKERNHKKKEDSFALFFRHSIKLGSENAIISMLLPSSLSNILAYKSLREYLLNFSILQITDYKRVFDSVLEKANNYIIRKTVCEAKAKIECVAEKKYNRTQKDFFNNPQSIFNFYTDDKTQKILNHLYSYPHKTLLDNASWALGIVTGNNSLYISKNKKDTPIYKGTNIVDGQITETNNYISNDFDKFHQVADMSFYTVKEKIVYRFISNNLSFAIDNKQRLFLNSANILIPDNNALKLNNKQITFLLNSKVMNFIFNSIFNTHKVLRNNLECLPLFYEFFDSYKSQSDYKEENLLKYLSLIEVDGKYKTVNKLIS